MTRAVLAAALALVACKKAAEAPPPSAGSDKPVMTVTEVKRDRDACNDYVQKLCACADKLPDNKDLHEQCKLAKAYPDTIETALDVAANTESTRRDALQAQATIRKVVATCISELAKLPGLGCP